MQKQQRLEARAAIKTSLNSAVAAARRGNITCVCARARAERLCACVRVRARVFVRTLMPLLLLAATNKPR